MGIVSWGMPSHPARLLARLALPLVLGSVLAGGVLGLPRVQAQETASLAGTWTIDRDNSQFPREVGFDADFVPVGRGEPAPGRRGLGGAALPALRPQGDSYEVAQRRQILTDEVRLPATRLTIADTGDTITLTDQQGNSRTFHPDGRAESLSLGTASVLTTARREGTSLVVLYAVADLRQIRYTYSRPAGTNALAVDVQFLDRGNGDVVRRIYVPAGAEAASTPARAAAGAETGASPAAPRTVVPRAGSEFSGLTRLGVVVEEPSMQAVNCGITRQAVEAAVSKPFSSAGLKVSTNADEDTYVHVSIMTSVMPTGMCISRYDWSIYSMTDATLSYQRSPVLAQVLLARKGGLTGSLPATHGADVVRGLDEGLTQIAAIIRDANR